MNSTYSLPSSWKAYLFSNHKYGDDTTSTINFYTIANNMCLGDTIGWLYFLYEEYTIESLRFYIEIKFSCI